MKYHHGNLGENLIKEACSACEDLGWENISLRNLAKSLDVSQTAPYRHFDTKEELLAEVAALGFIKLSNSVSDSAKFLEKGLAYCDFALKNPNTYDLMFGTAFSFSNYPNLLQASRGTFESLKKDLVLHYEDNGLKNVSEEVVAEKALAVWAFVHGLVGILKKTQAIGPEGIDGGPLMLVMNLSKDLDKYIERSVNSILAI